MSRAKPNVALLGLVAILASFAMIVVGCGGGKSSNATNDSQAVPFDRAFIDAMVPHHLSAVDMASAAREAGLKQPVLLGIANNIVNNQQREIDEMQQWRKEWYGSSKVDPEDGDGLGMSMGEMGMSHTPADIKRAADVDAAFASMMIDHHQGAVAMAQLALAKATHPEIRKLAH